MELSQQENRFNKWKIEKFYLNIFRQDYHNIVFNDLLSEMIDIAEDIQGSTLRKNIFPESKKQELNKNKQKILDAAVLNYWGSGIFTLFSKSYLVAIPEISLEFRFLVLPKTAFARWTPVKLMVFCCWILIFSQDSRVFRWLWNAKKIGSPTQVTSQSQEGYLKK